MESADTTSAEIGAPFPAKSASSIAVFPEAVGPKRRITGITGESVARARFIGD